MADIKVRNVVKGTVKTFDRSRVATEKTKDNMVSIKNKSENAYSSKDENIYGYASNRLSSSSKNLVIYSKKFNRIGYNAVKDNKNNIVKSKEKLKNIKVKLTEKKKSSKTKKEIKSALNIIKKEKKKALETKKATVKAARLAKEASKRTYQSLKAAIKLSIKGVKVIISGTKALISALIGMSWIAIIIIIVIMLVALLCSSGFGIFFSSEKTTSNDISMNEVIKDINIELTNKILKIQNENEYDDYKIISNRAEWKDVLMIYVAKISNGNMDQEVMTINDDKIETLKDIFWDMHSISFEIKKEINEVTDLESQDLERNILYISISSKTMDEMIKQYNFSTLQKEQIGELSKNEYSSLWTAPIYGTHIGSPSIVQIALQEVGNVGGEKYWSWYGFSSRVEWCAIFISWIANESGYINSNVIPKFAGVGNGIDWFKALGQWENSNYIPKTGDIIFFDWENDGKPNHVGIVEKVVNNYIYTVEGNSNDECKTKTYDVNSDLIVGYGTPFY